MRAVKLTSTSSARELLPKDSEEVLVLEGGHAVALVTPFDDDDAEWYARERDPQFIESIRRAREQVKRGETFSDSELSILLAEKLDGISFSGFSNPVSVETLRRTKCSQVPTDSGVYVVLRSKTESPKFLKRSVGGRFKGKNPTAPLDFLASHWVKDATVLYVGKGDGAKGLRQRLWQFIQFGMGKNIGHWGGRLVWQLADHQQLMVRWKPTEKEDPGDAKAQLIRQFKTVHAGTPFANLNDKD
jgi:hypothetical protein